MSSKGLPNGHVTSVAPPGRSMSEMTLVNGLASVSKAEVMKMNLMAIRKMDGQVSSIVKTVPRVILYQYEKASNTWERTSVEGTLFVYRRDSVPNHGFVILNRLSSDNVHELLRPGMEFRVQSPFVLFKRSSASMLETTHNGNLNSVPPGAIFGMCFSEELLCQEIGQLLTGLSAGTLNGYSNGARCLSPSRSSSTPAFKHQETTRHSGEYQQVDILEMLENANRGYLNQTFSDDASSQGSPPSEAITFSAPPEYSHLQHKEDARLRRSFDSRTRSEPVASPSTARKRNEPVASNRGRKPQSGRRAGSPNTTVTAKTKNLQRGQSDLSPMVTRNKVTMPKHVPPSQGGSPSQSNPLQRGASFSSKTSHSVDNRRLHNNSLPGSRSNSPFSTSPQRTTNPSTGEDPSLNISRKLFSPDLSGDDLPSKTSTLLSSSTPSTLQTLFSQASIADSGGKASLSISSSSSTTLLPLKAISLVEIEKQLKAEVPSPESITFASKEGLLSASQEQLKVLLQPSAFVTVGSTVSMTSEATVNSSTHSYSTSTPSNPGLPLPHTVDDTPVSSLQPLTVSVQPPTPVASHTFPLGALGGMLQSQLASPLSFPPIPPLMHSPGMKAAPVTSQQPQETDTPVVTIADTAVREMSEQAIHSLHIHSSASERPHRTGVDTHTAQISTDTVQQTAAPPPLSSKPQAVPPLNTSASTLMSPMQFANRTDCDKPDLTSALTQDQFKEALLHLIQHNEDFISTLHHAYLQTMSCKQ